MTDTSSTLADLLRLATWGPRDLAAAINTRLSRQGRDRLRIDPTAAYFWLRGGQPRPHVRGLVAAVLSERLGFKVDVSQLWPGSETGEVAVRAASSRCHMWMTCCGNSATCPLSRPPL
jgi:hypothetical protein